MQPSTKTALLDSAYQRQMALSRWDNEGGAELLITHIFLRRG